MAQQQKRHLISLFIYLKFSLCHTVLKIINKIVSEFT